MLALRRMANPVTLSARDLALLKLLSWTPAPTALLQRASVTFDDGPFLDERRLRERLQRLCDAGLVRSWSTAHAGGGLQKYYKLAQAGFERLYGPDQPAPPRAFFAEISPSLFEHTLGLAEVIVETLRACHSGRITIDRFFRENELTFTVGEAAVQPDCFFRFLFSGKPFNVAFEIDMSQESVDSRSTTSIREKLRLYDAYQASLLAGWHAAGRTWERPRFRTVFLTRSIERAHHILTLASRISANPQRRLIYAATQETFLGDARPLQSPMFLDHQGSWQALVDLHPGARFRKSPVHLDSQVEGLPIPW